MSVVVIGYASVDHVVRIAEAPQLDRTVRISGRPEAGWGSAGGSPAYVCRALAAEGVTAPSAISWVGDDGAGEDYCRGLQANAVDISGIEAVPDARTPMSILAYAETGGCACLYDPGMPEQELNPVQAGLIGQADLLVVTVGPAAALEQALDLTPPGASVAWLVKADPASFTDTLRHRLAARSDFIAHSEAERGFIDDALAASIPAKGRLVVETQGAAGLTWRYERPGEPLETHRHSVNARDTPDQTGAGDTLAGGILAGLIAELPAEHAIERGLRAVNRLLNARDLSPEPTEESTDREDDKR